MGTYVYLCLIHIVVRQRPIQHCKAIILHLKKKKEMKVKKKSPAGKDNNSTTEYHLTSCFSIMLFCPLAQNPNIVLRQILASFLSLFSFGSLGRFPAQNFNLD